MGCTQSKHTQVRGNGTNVALSSPVPSGLLPCHAGGRDSPPCQGDSSSILLHRPFPPREGQSAQHRTPVVTFGEECIGFDSRGRVLGTLPSAPTGRPPLVPTRVVADARPPAATRRTSVGYPTAPIVLSSRPSSHYSRSHTSDLFTGKQPYCQGSPDSFSPQFVHPWEARPKPMCVPLQRFPSLFSGRAPISGAAHAFKSSLVPSASPISPAQGMQHASPFMPPFFAPPKGFTVSMTLDGRTHFHPCPETGFVPAASQSCSFSAGDALSARSTGSHKGGGGGGAIGSRHRSQRRNGSSKTAPFGGSDDEDCGRGLIFGIDTARRSRSLSSATHLHPDALLG